jgi:hypothetical protein
VKAPKFDSVTYQRMIAERDQHLAAARHIDSALAVIAEFAKREKKQEKRAATLTRKVAKRAARPEPTASGYSADANRRTRDRKARNDRPIDRVRVVFGKAGKTPLTIGDVVEHARLAEYPHASGSGGIQRMAGIILHRLVNSGELKRAGDGFVARKLKVDAASNGNAHA